MSVILNLRGTNGSGKTSAVKWVMSRTDPAYVTPILEPGVRRGKRRILPNRIIGYELAGRVRVVGAYETATGGCDGFSEQQYYQDLVTDWADQGFDVIFEGVLASTVWGRWAQFDNQLTAAGHTYVWVFMNTPLEQCVQNVYKRNGGKPIKEDLVKNKWEIVQRHIARTEAEQRLSFVINQWQRGGEGLMEALHFGREHEIYRSR